MISTPIHNGQIDYTFFTKEESLSLSKIRIIKKNLVHVHGFPLSIAKVSILRKKEYFGQYGKIQRILLNHKINPETNKKLFSVYITYSNEKEASFAILSVDSLLIEGKIIRAFFGTTKYCNYFLNNISCPNMDKCLFLHKLVKDKDIIIDSNTLFSYNEHLNLAKKIIQFSNPETQNLVKGTIIRIFSLPKGEKLCTFKRGISSAFIFCLNFSGDSEKLISTSDTGMLHIFDIKEELENKEKKNNESSGLIKVIGRGLVSVISSILPKDYEDSFGTQGAAISFTSDFLKMSNLVGFCVDKTREAYCFTSDGTYYLFHINYTKKTIEKIYERNMKEFKGNFDVNNKSNYIPL